MKLSLILQYSFCLPLNLVFLSACSDDAAGPSQVQTPAPSAAAGGGPASGGQQSLPAQAAGSPSNGGRTGLPAGSGGANEQPMGSGGTNVGGMNAGGANEQPTGGGGTNAGGMNVGGAGTGPDPDSGEALYVEHCGLCHGDDAMGKADAQGKTLGPDVRHPEEAYAKYLIREGSDARETADIYFSPMPRASSFDLSDEAMDKIIAYLNDRVVFPQPTTGEGLYVDYCLVCHAADGSGAPTGRPLTGADVTPQKTKELIRSGVHTDMPHDKREFMPKRTVEELTDAEIDLIAEYVDKL